MLNKLILAVGLLVLTGCSNSKMDSEDLRQFIIQENKRPPGTVEAIPSFMPVESYTYDYANLRDPFVLIKAVDLEIDENLVPDKSRVQEVLEAYALDELRMVGTLGSGKQINGIVRAPDGRVYTVKAGDYMGQSFGQIRNVSESRIDLIEVILDNNSRSWVEREASLPLLESEGVYHVK